VESPLIVDDGDHPSSTSTENENAMLRLALAKKSATAKQVEERCRALEEKLKENEGKMGEYESQVSGLKCEKADLGERLEQQCSNLDRVSLALSISYVRVNRVEDDYADTKKAEEEGRSNLFEMKTRCGKAERDLEKTRNRCGELEKALLLRESALLEMKMKHEKALLSTELLRGRCLLLENLAEGAEAKHVEEKSKCDKLRSELSDQSEKVKDLQHSLSRKGVLEREVRVAELELLSERLQNENTLLQSASTEAEAKTADLLSKIEAMTEAHDLETGKLRNQSEDMEQKNNAWKKQTQQLETTTIAQQVTINQLQQDLEEKGTLLDGAIKARDEQVGARAQDREELSSLEQMVKQGNESVRLQQLKIESLSCELLEMKNRAKQHEKSSAATNAKYKNLERERDLLIADLKVEREALVSYLKAFEELKAEKNTLRAVVKSLDEKLVVAVSEKEKMAAAATNSPAETLKGEPVDAESEILSQLTDLTGKLESAVKEKNAAEAETSDLAKKLQAAIEERNSMAAELAFTEEEKEKSAEDVKALSDQAETAKTVIRTLEIALSKEIKVKTSTSGDQHSDRSVEPSETDLKRPADRHKSEISSDVENHRAAAEKATQEADALREENKKFVEELQRQKRKQKELQIQVNVLMENRHAQTNYQQKLDNLREARAAKCVNLEMELSRVRDTFKFMDSTQEGGLDSASDDDDDRGVINANGCKGRGNNASEAKSTGLLRPWGLL